jgi:hypothetical protein
VLGCGRLNVRYNSITDEGLEELLAGAQHNSSLTHLLLWVSPLPTPLVWLGNSDPGDMTVIATGQGNQFGTASSNLLHKLLQGRFAHLHVFVDITTYVVDDVVYTAEVSLHDRYSRNT